MGKLNDYMRLVKGAQSELHEYIQTMPETGFSDVLGRFANNVTAILSDIVNAVEARAELQRPTATASPAEADLAELMPLLKQITAWVDAPATYKRSMGRGVSKHLKAVVARVQTRMTMESAYEAGRAWSLRMRAEGVEVDIWPSGSVDSMDDYERWLMVWGMHPSIAPVSVWEAWSQGVASIL